jgi:hypothetical protein
MRLTDYYKHMMRNFNMPPSGMDAEGKGPSLLIGESLGGVH